MKEIFAGKKLATTQIYLFVSTFLNILFAIIIVYLAKEVAYQAMHNKVVLQPPFPIDKPINVGWNNGEIEKKMLSKIGELISLWTMNFTPEDIQKRFYKILTYVDADSYLSIKKILDDEIYRLKQNNITQNFYPSSVDVDEEKIIVRGMAIRYIAEQKLDATQNTVTIYYIYRPETGFQIKSIIRKKG